MVLIELEDVSKKYSNFSLDSVDLELKEGEILGLLGPNGAGKSTTMGIISGEIKRDSGKVSVLGMDPEKHEMEVRKDIGVLPEREDPPSFLTGEEYLEFVSDVRKHPMDWDMTERLHITDDKLKRQTRKLSKGERQKLMIIQAFFHDPEVTLIDEPLINLDPIVQREVKQIFRERRKRGHSMILSTHVVSLAEEVCDRVLILENGSVKKEVENTENLREALFDEDDENSKVND